LGAINIHASLLPKYRGPAPIQWAVINGEKETGVTAMQMDAGVDTGDILGAARTPISNDDTAQTLHDRLSRMGAALLVETLEKGITGRLQAVPQDHARATYAPMLKKSDGRIDWRAPAHVIERRIRGLTPWPGAFTLWKEKTIRIFKARVEPEQIPAAPGEVLASEAVLKVATGSGVLCLLEIQAASGRRMTAQEFLKGNRIPQGSRLS
jgi:methionyl-tRNA formyltransferase